MRSKLSSKQSLLVILLLLTTSTIVYLWDFLFELRLELLSSIVVVALTIFGINKLLQRREQLRWRQAKSRLFEEINGHLNCMLTAVGPLADIQLPYPSAPGFDKMSLDYFVQHGGEILAKHFKESFTSFPQQQPHTVRQRDYLYWNWCFDVIESSIRELDRSLSTIPPIALSPNLHASITSLRSGAALFLMFRPVLLPFSAALPPTQLASSDLASKLVADLGHIIAVGLLQRLVKAILQLKEQLSPHPHL